MPYNFQFTDKDVDDIRQQAEQSTQQSASSRQMEDYKPRPHTPWLSEGTYTFRIYPDRTSQGFARISRRIVTHRNLPIGLRRDGKYMTQWGVWADTRVDQIVAGMIKAGMTDKTRVANNQLWSYRSRADFLMCVHMFESSDKEHIPENSSYVIQLNDGQNKALQAWIKGMHPEEERINLDPNNDKAPGVRITISKQNDRYVYNVSTTSWRQFSLPLPPKLRDAKLPDVLHDFEGLDKIMITENDTITDQQFFEFKKIMDAELERFKASATPAIDATQSGYRLSDSGGAKSLRDELDDDIPF